MQEDDKDQSTKTIQIRKPKRIIHCSDGIYEEYSDEEEEVVQDPKDLSLIRRIGHSIIFGLDYLGEGLANFLNITTPKYAYEIEQYKKMEEERKNQEQLDKDNTWKTDSADEATNPITEPPRTNEVSTVNH